MNINEWWGVDLERGIKPDNDLMHMHVSDLELEIVRLRNAIRAHRDAKGDDRCWLDDVELYKQLPETTEADFTLPPTEEFLASCEKYCASRQPPKE